MGRENRPAEVLQVEWGVRGGRGQPPMQHEFVDHANTAAAQEQQPGCGDA